MFDMAPRALLRSAPSLSICRLAVLLPIKSIEDRIAILDLAVILALSNAGAYGARYLRVTLAHLTGLYACARP